MVLKIASIIYSYFFSIRKDSRVKIVNEDASLALLKRNALRDSEVQSILQEKSPEKLTVLVAEDNMINQRVLKRLLESIGLRSIDFAEDGVKAIEACAKRKYDLVFMDIMVRHIRVSCSDWLKDAENEWN